MSREAEVRGIKQQVTIQKRRINEHSRGTCEKGTFDNPCVEIAYERGILVGLYRALSLLGIYPAECDP